VETVIGAIEVKGLRAIHEYLMGALRCTETVDAEEELEMHLTAYRVRVKREFE
jgi:hypothetical protein